MRGDTHPSMMKFREELIESFGFYDGSGQWSLDDIKTVKENGMIPLVYNIIQGRVDTLSGVEIQSRFRTAIHNDSGLIQHDELAKALTHLLYFIQQDQDIPHKGSLKFTDQLICGIGWSNIYQEDGQYFYENVHPANIIPDMDDLSPQFENMKFVGRKRWMDPQMVTKLWPKVASYINFSDPKISQTVYSPELVDRNTTFTNLGNYVGYSQSRVLVGEVQHKKPRKSYYGIDYQGFYFETFDEEKAEEIANSPQDINEKQSYQIMRTLFLDQYLLEHSPLNPNIPNLKDFSYIPSVWKRRYSTGVPYGIVDAMKDMQRDGNVRLTKALYLSNSSRLIIKGSLPAGKTEDDLTEQLKRPDAVLVLPSQCEFDMKSNEPISHSQIEMLHEYDKFIQRATGIYDDLMGKPTNASSGVAQRQRQINSVRNNVFAFDNFASMKKREANFLMAMIQGGDNENMLSQILTEDEKESIVLNLTRTVNGKKFVFNDVRTLPVTMQVEEVPDYQNSAEENKAALENLLSNPNGMLIMQSPTLMRRLGIRDYEQLAQEMKETMSMQQENKQVSQSAAQQPQQLDQNLAYPGL